jgi:hypothetical protein
MKSNTLKFIIILGFLAPMVQSNSFGQSSGFDDFSVKVSPGALSYFGDLSNDNLNLPKRIVYGSKFGIGIGIIKQFSPYFGLQAQFVTGSTYSEAVDNTYFAGSLNEYSLSARFDPLGLIKDKSFKVAPYLAVGVGTLGFRSVRRQMDTNLVLLPDFGYEDDGVTRAPRKTAMSLPITLGVSWRVLPDVQIELEHSLRFTNTDLIDSYKGPSTANDLYSLTSIGFRYTIPTQSAGKRSGNKNQEDPSAKKTDNEAKNLIDPSADMNVFVDCTIPEKVQPGQVVDVKIRINKGLYIGPAKLIQKFPEGLTAIENLKNTISFLFSNQNVLVEWKKMPGDATVLYNYQMKVSETLTGSQTITGRFEYQDVEGTKTVRFNKTIFVEGNADNQGKDEKVAEVRADSSPVLPNRNIRKSQALPGIEFRVQCGALRDASKAYNQLSEKYRITETIQEEFIDGWYKYTVGSFRTYDEAAKYRDSFIARTNILSAFIVAYRDGVRLANINEALR